VLDSYDAMTSIDGWIRETLIAGLPRSVSVVIGSRNPAGDRWRTDQAWRAISTAISLGPLSPEESREYFVLRNVTNVDIESALAFAHGHPLALALIADVVGSVPGRPFRPELAPHVVQMLVRAFVDRVPSPALRAALELCALVRSTNETLIAAVLETDDAGALFNWLCGLSIIQLEEAGIFPHAAAREVLLADLRWRDPERLASLRDRALRFYLDRFVRSGIADQQRFISDAFFLRREMPEVHNFWSWAGLERFTAAQATSADTPEIRELVARHEGEESAAIAVHWLERQPGSAVVLRDRDGGGLAAFLSFVALERTSVEERAVDPAASAVWRYLEARDLLEDGGRITLNRWMTADGYQELSAAQTACGARVTHYHYVTASISHSFVVFADPHLYAQLFAFIGFSQVPECRFILGGRRYAIFWRDWREEPPLDWLRKALWRMSGDPPPAPKIEAGARIGLSRATFAKAVREAFRSVREPHRLITNPLVGARFITARAGPSSTTGDRTSLLQSILRESVAQLAGTPRGAKLAAALERTYLDPADTQEAAAEELGLPFSTYRRHLVSGIEEITEILWQAEHDG
jgi:hypothetical protein